MFSILTPTYNRLHTLERVYNSLLNQTFKDFEWIIVDDGSSDKTEELINHWRLQKKMIIKFYKLKKNQGKSFAVNFGLQHCSYPYTIIADSDDRFENETLDKLNNIWSTINTLYSNSNIASIWSLTKDLNNNIIGDKFPKNFWQVNFKERILDNNIKGEKWSCWRTEILSTQKMYVQSNCHIEESQTWNKININYDFICINKAFRIYYDSPDGIIARKKSRPQIAINEYYSAYYGLKDVNFKNIIYYKHYRSLAFNYIKSKIYIKEKKMVLSKSQLLISVLIFLFNAPYRILKKLV